MNDLLNDLGYTFDPVAFRDTILAIEDKYPTPGIEGFFEAAAPHIVMAYQAGLAGERLNDTYAFIKENRPGATNTGTAQEPKPCQIHTQSTTSGATLSNAEERMKNKPILGRGFSL